MEQISDHPAPPDALPPPTIQIAIRQVRPYVTYAIFGVTIFVYLLQLAGQALNFDLITFLGIKYNDFIRAGQLWRLITPVFLHGSLAHIALNMYALFIYGRNLEKHFGHRRFFLLYFLSAFAGNVFSFIFNTNPSLGASTAIFGLVGAELMFVLQNRQLLESPGSQLMNLVYIVFINLVLGFTSRGIDNFGHLGGLLGGLVFTRFGGPRWKVEGTYPFFRLVDERKGQGGTAGALIVLLIFVPLSAIGWLWPK